MSIRYIVCAAIRNHAGLIIPGPRHFDETMHKLIDALGGDWRSAEQGFIDQNGVFLTREEAKIVADDADQLVMPDIKWDEEKLYSEDLY